MSTPTSCRSRSTSSASSQRGHLMTRPPRQLPSVNCFAVPCAVSWLRYLDRLGPPEPVVLHERWTLYVGIFDIYWAPGERGHVMQSINYNHLLYFWHVAREGGLVQAGRVLRLSHPTLSAQIHALEDQLGEKLFVKSGRRL